MPPKKLNVAPQGKTPVWTRRNADRHTLYQQSVQSPSYEVFLLTRIFERHAGRKPQTLREDFCGTALLCAEWVKSKPTRTATGLDIDVPTLDWGREKNLATLGPPGERITLLEQNVLKKTAASFEVICAFNYSYSIFKTRALLRSYFEAAYASLKPEGVLALDGLGGWDAQKTCRESRKLKGFTYVWEQAAFDPTTSDFLAHIHFEFPDGTKLNKAFTYDWRLWSIQELREMMQEAGFVDIDVYWEGVDEKGEASGTFERVTKTTNDPAWNMYLVGKKRPALRGSKDAKRTYPSK